MSSLMKCIAVSLSAVLAGLSFGSQAYATVVKSAVSVGGSHAPVAAGGAAGPRILSLTAPLNSRNLKFSGVLPSVSSVEGKIAADAGVRAINAAAVAVSNSFAASPSGVSARPDNVNGLVESAEKGPKDSRQSIRKRIERVSKSAAPEIEAAANLADAAGESAYGVGRRIESILTGRTRGLRWTDLSGANYARDPERVLNVRFSEDWIEPADAYEAAAAQARALIQAPEFLFAEVDIQKTESGLRVIEGRFGFYGLRYEQWARVRVRPSEKSDSYDVAADQFGNKYLLNMGAVMLSEPIKGKLDLAQAIVRADAVMPGFEPVRALYMRPSHILSDAQGMIYRLIDKNGTVVDVDALTGILTWSPRDVGGSVSDNFIAGKVPAPTSRDVSRTVERNPSPAPLDRFLPQTLGALAFAGVLTATVLGLSYFLQLSAAGFFLPVLLIGGFAALMVYVSGIGTNSVTQDHYATNPALLSVGQMMMIGTLLFAALVLGLGTANVLPLATGAAFAGMGGWITAPRVLHNPNLMFDRAYGEAVAKAQELGYEKGDVYFGDAGASMPVVDGNQWKFTFYAAKNPGEAQADQIFVELNNGWDVVWGKYGVKTHVYKGVAVPADQPITVFSPDRFSRATQVGPEQALDFARSKYWALGRNVSVSLRVVKEGENGPRSLWYHFFNEYGAEVAVQASKSVVRILRENPEKPTLEQRKQQWRMIKKLRDMDSWMGEHVPLYDVLKWIALVGAAIWLADAAFGLTLFNTGIFKG